MPRLVSLLACLVMALALAGTTLAGAPQPCPTGPPCNPGPPPSCPSGPPCK
jgi:hypothetical protein